MDETLKSTQENNTLLKKMITDLGGKSNRAILFATHDLPITQLEKELPKTWKNKHVEIFVEKDQHGNVVKIKKKTFKLKDGPEFINIAGLLMHESGLVN